MARKYKLEVDFTKSSGVKDLKDTLKEFLFQDLTEETLRMELEEDLNTLFEAPGGREEAKEMMSLTVLRRLLFHYYRLKRNFRIFQTDGDWTSYDLYPLALSIVNNSFIFREEDNKPKE